ncbi:GNAT family N-acetyltransferase [Portibacter lacus]|nr:GNAT family N-acetyltransferase [Portibacter lacus]
MQEGYLFFSERLGFRLWKETDLKIYTELSSDPEVMRFFPQEFWLDERSAKLSISGFQKHYREYGFTYFAVDKLDTADFIGFIGVKTISYDAFFAPAVDIGWRLHKDFWGNGYATEGAKRTLAWFFENFDLDRIVSMTPEKNIPSENVMIKIGMNKIETFNHPLLVTEDPLSKHVLYEIKK